MKDLLSGHLSPLLERVHADHTLCLELRNEAVNIYYRGGNLLRIARGSGGYAGVFDPSYTTSTSAGEIPKPGAGLNNAAEVKMWISSIPLLKLGIDLNKSQKEEREAQQQIVRDNNFGRMSTSTDFFLCDIEYNTPFGQFDLVGVEWLSKPHIRKQQHQRRLAIIEAKFGDNAVSGNAGISDHIIDINQFLASKTNVDALKIDMLKVFNQKQELGLITCKKRLLSFSEEPPLLILLLANHDPDSTLLRTQLQALPPSPHAQIHIAISTFMGYGLFKHAVIPLGTAQTRFPEWF